MATEGLQSFLVLFCQGKKIKMSESSKVRIDGQHNQLDFIPTIRISQKKPEQNSKERRIRARRTRDCDASKELGGRQGGIDVLRVLRNQPHQVRDQVFSNSCLDIILRKVNDQRTEIYRIKTECFGKVENESDVEDFGKSIGIRP